MSLGTVAGCSYSYATRKKREEEERLQYVWSRPIEQWSIATLALLAEFDKYSLLASFLLRFHSGKTELEYGCNGHILAVKVHGKVYRAIKKEIYTPETEPV